MTPNQQTPQTAKEVVEEISKIFLEYDWTLGPQLLYEIETKIKALIDGKDKRIEELEKPCSHREAVLQDKLMTMKHGLTRAETLLLELKYSEVFKYLHPRSQEKINTALNPEGGPQ